MTDNSSKEIAVKKIPCIYYPVWFQESQRQENQEQIRVLLDSDSKVNTMNSDYTRKLGFKIKKTNGRSQKIDGST